MWKKAVFPSSEEQAAALLQEARGQAKILGGGTDLIPQYREGKESHTLLVDVTRIPGFDRIEERDGQIILGGAFTHTQAAEHPLLRRHAQALCLGSGVVGSPQIRNVGTLSGNIVNAQPAADGAIALIALDAQAEILSPEGLRTVPVAGLYEGVGRSRVDSTRELICSIRFPALRGERHEASAVERLAIRRALALPMVNVAVSLGLDGSRLAWVRAAMGPVARTPFRPYELERQAAGMPATADTAAEFARQAAAQVHPRDSALRGSAEYRTAMVEVLLRRAMTRAIQTALEGGS